MTLLKHWRSILIAFFVVLGICGICFLVGYKNGSTSGSQKVRAQWDQENKTRENATTKIESSLQSLSEHFNNLALITQSNQTTQKEIIYKEVIKYAEKDHAPANVVDNDWLSIYNKSIYRADKE